MTPRWHLECTACRASHPGTDVRYRCDCGETLDVVHDFSSARRKLSLDLFDRRLGSREASNLSGVWRFRELILPLEQDEVITRPEGNTNLYRRAKLEQYVGLRTFHLKHEGENPTGSFKDRGMTVGVSMARKLGMNRVACASTGNTSASMAAYAAQAGMTAYVFIPHGRIAHGRTGSCRCR